MPPAGDDDGIGRRIARQRKLRGLTQHGLAMRANVAYGTLTKVESGHALPSAAVVAAVARALHIDPAEIVGQPFVHELRAANVDQFIEPLRVAFDSFDLLPPEDVTPRETETIAAEVSVLCDDAMVGGQVAQAAARLPGLLDELGAVVAADDGDGQAWRALSAAYRCARHVVLNWGLRDLADIALDRSTQAGVNGGDGLAAAVHRRARASNHLRAGSYDSGRQLLAAALQDAEEAEPGVRRDVLAGHTHLGWAINSARSGDLLTAHEHLDAAGPLAERTGEVPTVGWFGFGPTNVAVHRVAVLIESANYGDAIEAAESVHLPPTWSATRSAHHWMDLGRAHAALGHVDHALEVLNEARLLAPQQTRFHPTARHAIEHLLLTKRRVPEPLASYARWLGL